jgi:transcriptional regulator with PAS, ATPase and Fis domain
VGKSRDFFRVLHFIDCVKNNSVPVFIYGESGTGKEVVAKTIHSSGSRKTRKFVAVNCGAIPDHLLESELFGYARGAFTGAVKEKPGLIEEANQGTFFLDEIGDLSRNLQAKLLRVIQEKEIRRIGENRMRSVDVRFISATNKNIEKEVSEGRFREDLYYRLNIVSVSLSPLRKRREDIHSLVNHLIDKYCFELKREKIYFTPGALQLMLRYSWPGNVRELQNEIQRCLILCGDDNLIREEYLSEKMRKPSEESFVHLYDYFRAKAEFERRFLNEALARSDYNRTQTAKEIGLSRQGLFKLMKKHGIQAGPKNEHV